MPDRKRAARLVGGPFDGDRGSIVTDDPEIPPTIWAWPCPHKSRCSLGGIHWYLDGGPPGAARYEHQGHEQDQQVRLRVELYVWDGVGRPDLLTIDAREPVMA